MDVFIDADIFVNFYYFSNEINYLNKIKHLIMQKKIRLHLTENVIIDFLCKRRNLFLKCKNFKNNCTVRYKKFTNFSQFISNQKNSNTPIAEIDSILLEIFRASNVINLTKKDVLKIFSKHEDHLTKREILNWQMLLENIECDLHLISPHGDYFYKNTSIIKEQLQDEWERNVFTPFKILGYRSMSSFLIKHFPIEMAGNNIEELQVDFLLKKLPQVKTFSEIHRIVKKLNQFILLNPQQLEAICDIFIHNRFIKWMLSDQDIILFIRKLIEKYKRIIDPIQLSQLKNILLNYTTGPLAHI
ncbi:hypothetical protein [Legionella cardiaca]|uniref:DUF4935 domain-containing protein n=1 Tax=Legionella cardiaca TaxID=1071983 RepID=A0ABY8AY14_9GAMM|nr:hypothetical protein [Legionella cardiaca]WED44002.1 hypothetical protein PXX05_04240 [Legionella cardiaca]